MRALARGVWRTPQWLLVGFIRIWRLVISPLYGPVCKYYPSCSAYGLTAAQRFGAVRGSILIIWRLVRCNPWSLGGVDEVPESFRLQIAPHDPQCSDHDATAEPCVPFTATAPAPTGRPAHPDHAPSGRAA